MTVVDTTTPTLSLPSDIGPLEADTAGGRVVTYAASASDAVDGPVALLCTSSPTAGLASGSLFPVGVTTITCTSTDRQGNDATAKFTVTIVDTGTPALTGLPADITLESTDGAPGPGTFALPTATDVVDGLLPVTCSPASGAAFPLGETTVTCSAADRSGNAVSGSFLVIVLDRALPALTGLPSDATLEATGPAGAVHTFELPKALDAVDGLLAATCAPAPGSPFPLGETTVACGATDAAGNAVEGLFKVLVVDTTAPTLAVPANVRATATEKGAGVVSFADATATDLVDGVLAPTCAPGAGSAFPLGETTVSCSAVDLAGNLGSATFTVVVEAGALSTISVAPPKASVVVATGKEFAATGADAFGNAVAVAPAWTATCGTVGTTGAFVAPAKTGACVVKASVQAISAVADVTVVAGPAMKLVLTPGGVTLAPKGTGAFTVSGRDQHGNTVAIDLALVKFSISPSSGGTFDGAAVTAGTVAGSYGVTATLGDASGHANLRVVPGPVAKIDVSPSVQRVVPDRPVSFSGVAYDAFGNRVPDAGIAWSVTNAAVGRIHQTSGKFTSATPGETKIVARDAASGTEGTAVVDVIPTSSTIERLEILPVASTIQAGATVNLVVVGYDAAGTAFAGLPFTLTSSDPKVGFLASSGAFTGYKTGTTTITARLHELATTAKVEVVPGPLAQIRVVPSHATIPVGDTLRFQAFGFDAYNNARPGTVTVWENENPELGGIDQDGLYRAGDANGVATLRARSGDVMREFVVTIVGAVAKKDETTTVVSNPALSTMGGVTSLDQVVGLKEAEQGAKVSIPPPAAPLVTEEKVEKEVANAFRSAEVTIGSAAKNLALVVEFHPGSFDAAPDEVDVSDLAKVFADKVDEETQPGLFISIQGTEDGQPLPSARLNEVVENLDLDFQVPESYFTENNLDPASAVLVEYSDGRQVRDDVPVTLLSATPIGGFYLYRATLIQFSSFAIIATKVVSSASASPGGGGAPAAPAVGRGFAAPTGAGPAIPLPSIDFEVLPRSKGYTVHFRALPKSVGADPTRFMWSLGDGTAMSDADPVHTYAEGPRKVRVELVLFVAGNAYFTAKDITLPYGNSAPAAGFRCVPDESCLFTTWDASFASIASDPNPTDSLTYRWDFGDGGPSSTDSAPVHRFPRRGTYTVRQGVTDGEAFAEIGKLVVVAPPLTVSLRGDTGLKAARNGFEVIPSEVVSRIDLKLKDRLLSTSASAPHMMTFELTAAELAEIEAEHGKNPILTLHVFDVTGVPHVFRVASDLRLSGVTIPEGAPAAGADGGPGAGPGTSGLVQSSRERSGVEPIRKTIEGDDEAAVGDNIRWPVVFFELFGLGWIFFLVFWRRRRKDDGSGGDPPLSW
ncbi:MAG: HYR domain-containing protein [Methanobacteriota archaeon]